MTKKLELYLANRLEMNQRLKDLVGEKGAEATAERKQIKEGLENARKIIDEERAKMKPAEPAKPKVKFWKGAKAKTREPVVREGVMRGPIYEKKAKEIPAGGEPKSGKPGDQVYDVLDRVFRGSNRTMGQKQLLAEARALFEDEGRGAGKEVRVQDMEAYLGSQVESQLQAPLPAFRGATNPGIFPGERVDIDLIDESKNRSAKNKAGYKYMAILQDRNTRKIYTEPTREKTGPGLVQVYKKLLQEVKDDTGDNVREINADNEGAFRGEAFNKMLSGRNTIIRFKQRTREGMSGTAQLDSAIGKWKNTLRKLREDDEDGDGEDFWRSANLATQQYNKLAHSGLDGNTPEQAMTGDKSGVMQFRRQEAAADTLEESQEVADKAKERLLKQGAFRRPLQDRAWGRKGPRAGQPKYEGRVYKVKASDLKGGMINIPEEGLFVPVDNVKAVPEESWDSNMKPDPTSNPEKKREALKEVVRAIEKVLDGEVDQQHLNRGLRAKAILKMKGKQDEWEKAFAAAGLGTEPNERARIARIQELFPEKFEKVNAGTAGEKIMMI